jgi:hypothetical protein
MKQGTRQVIQPQSEAPIVDGLCYDLTIGPTLPQLYKPMAMGQLEKVRKAQGLRPKWYAVPEQNGVIEVPSLGYYRAQIQVEPGSYLIGILPTNDVFTTITGFELKLWEGETGIQFFHNFVEMSAFIDAVPPTPDSPAIYLPEPRLILHPGWIGVEIANMFGGGAVPGVEWFMLLVAEPITPIQSGNCGSALIPVSGGVA